VGELPVEYLSGTAEYKARSLFSNAQQILRCIEVAGEHRARTSVCVGWNLCGAPGRLDAQESFVVRLSGVTDDEEINAWFINLFQSFLPRFTKWSSCISAAVVNANIVLVRRVHAFENELNGACDSICHSSSRVFLTSALAIGPSVVLPAVPAFCAQRRSALSAGN
jgi:hypothetical protein